MNHDRTADVAPGKKAPFVAVLSHRRRFMCGHSASTTGGLFKSPGGGRRAIAWTCADCRAKAEAA